MAGTSRSVVVGVTHGQADVVVHEAARLAAGLGADLVCVSVDLGRFVIEELADGTIASIPIDPDLESSEEFDPDLARHLRGLVADSQVPVSFRQVCGDPVLAISRLAAELNAEMIVVGSRGRSLRSTIKELFGGSIAAHLVHRQSRPVLVVPTAITPAGRPLPWEGAE